MKIFNTENGVDKAYVQLNDIKLLENKNLLSEYDLFDFDQNLDAFICFSKPKEVELFKSIDWIIDYKKTMCLTNLELINKEKKEIEKMERLSNQFSKMTPEERARNKGIQKSIELLNYKANSLAEILMYKNGNLQLSLPVVPDSDGFEFIGKVDSVYIVKQSLNHNIILLYRKDGKNLSNLDRIPRTYIDDPINLIITNRLFNKDFLENAEVKKNISDDKKYLIIEVKFNKTMINSRDSKIKKLFKTKNKTI